MEITLNQHDNENKKKITDAVSEEILQVAENLALKIGAHSITVGKIMKEIGGSNRMFYNRFSNIEEVLREVYRRLVEQMRKLPNPRIENREAFFHDVIELSVQVLTDTFDLKEHFSRYAFEHNALTEENRLWWMKTISDLVVLAKEKKFIQKADEQQTAYAMWCISRGYSFDAVSRNLTREEAVSSFRFGLEHFLKGLE